MALLLTAINTSAQDIELSFLQTTLPWLPLQNTSYKRALLRPLLGQIPGMRARFACAAFIAT